MSKIARYVLAGSSATAVNLLIAYVLTDVIGIWYVSSSVVGFACALIVSFLLQKVWTYRNQELARAHIEVMQFAFIACVMLAFNASSIFILVEHLNFHYLSAQMCIGILIAVVNYFCYSFIFKARDHLPLIAFWNEVLGPSQRALVIVAILSFGFLFIRVSGIDLPYHQDEWKTARVMVEGAEAVGGFFHHPPLTGVIFRAAGAVLPPDLFRLLPLLFTTISSFILYAVIVKRAGIRAGVLALFFLGVTGYSTLAALMLDVDGAILPFFALLVLYAYDRARVSSGTRRGVFGLLLITALLLGILVKLSFVIVIGAIVADYLFDRRVDMTFADVLWLCGWLCAFFAIAAVLLAAAAWLYPVFELRSMIDHALSYVRIADRNWTQIAFQAIKALLYTGPLAFFWIAFADREGLKQVRFFLLYLLFGAFFYFIAFDFSQGALDKYLMFTIVPVAAIAGVMMSRYLPKSLGSVRYSGTVSAIIASVLLILNFVPHSLMSLYPKTAWVHEIIDLHWRILFPFMGGSGPIGFYVSFLFIAMTFMVSVAVAAFAYFRPAFRTSAVIACIVFSVTYGGVFAEELLFGRINGSVSSVLDSSLAYIASSDSRSIITHNDIGAFPLWEMGKYAGRFYAAPQYEDVHRSLFADHNGKYLVIDMPKWNIASFYEEFFSSCHVEFEDVSGMITARVYTCIEAEVIE